jgi:alpha-D-ribose 1-methylphosphonate 5-triphosphate synthase subunit PhnH
VRAGLGNPVLDSQWVFRRVLEAMAHPGRVVRVDPVLDPPAPLGPASAAVCLTLLDFETPLWLDPATRSADAIEWLAFHCGAPIVAEPAAARFALIADPSAMPPLDAFEAGTDAMPDRSATLVIQVESLTAGRGVRLTGPGIRDVAALEIRGVQDDFWTAVRANAGRFPRGVDIVVVEGPQLAALPRTVRVGAG